MNKYLQIIFSLVAISFYSNVSLAHQDESHYIFNYDSGNTYDIKITDDTITWTGLSGPDKGISETDAIKRKSLSSNVEIIQWIEKDGSFVTVAFDHKNLTVVSSGRYEKGTWFWNGTVDIL